MPDFFPVETAQSYAIRSIMPSSQQTTIMFFPVSIFEPGPIGIQEILRQAIDGVYVETDQFFRFRINPSNLRVAKGKLSSLTFTKLGYERSHHGNELTKLEYTGTTGYMRPPSIVDTVRNLGTISNAVQRQIEIARSILSGSMDITQSPVWQKFRRFERFVDRLDSEVVLYYDFRLFTGQLARFNYTEDANDPLQIKYGFSFEARTDAPTGPDRFGKELINLAER